MRKQTGIGIMSPYLPGLTKTSRVGKPAYRNETFSSFGAFFWEGDMIERLEESRWAGEVNTLAMSGAALLVARAMAGRYAPLDARHTG
jgi:hypothetical protein